MGKIPIFTNIFQMGWNHQPAMWYYVILCDLERNAGFVDMYRIRLFSQHPLKWKNGVLRRQVSFDGRNTPKWIKGSFQTGKMTSNTTVIQSSTTRTWILKSDPRTRSTFVRLDFPMFLWPERQQSVVNTARKLRFLLLSWWITVSQGENMYVHKKLTTYMYTYKYIHIYIYIKGSKSSNQWLIGS